MQPDAGDNPSMRAAASLAAMLLLAPLFGACAKAPASADAARVHTLSVFAASSLREAFQALGPRFSATHPGVTVTFTFAGSQELRTQIEHGAPADVFASADDDHMNALVTAREADAPVVFAKNNLVIVCPKDGTTVTSLETLPSASRIVVGAPTVPVGRYAARLLDAASQRYGTDFKARVEAKIVSREANVRQVLAKVTLGEADAAIVYRTDAAVAKDVRVVDLPPELAFDTAYPIAVLRAAHAPELARAWVDFVRTPEAQAVLAGAKFLPP